MMMMIRFLFFVIIIFVITLREWLLRAHDAVGVMLLRIQSARTVLVLLHNPTARCHGIPKESAVVGIKKKNDFPNNAIEQNPVNR
jgi:hypothetical protein